MRNVFDDQVFEKYDISQGLDHEFNDCTFRNCDFSNLQINSAELVDCKFESCNLAMLKLDNTVLNKVKFINCKILGVDFSKCSKFLFSISFENSILNYSLFHKNDLKSTVFNNCNLQEVSFLETNLTSAKFIECDLTSTVFDGTNLEKADFTTSRNYIINPETNRLKKARFSLPDVIGLLNHLDIEIQ